MENLHTKRTSTGSNFGWLIPQQMSIRIKKVGGRRFVEGFYQALFSVALPAGNRAESQNEKKRQQSRH